MPKIKRIDIKEFRAKGFLQEINRQYLHPLGMAFEVLIHEDGSESLGGIWDYRDDSEGIVFGKNMIDQKKIDYVEKLRKEKAIYREKNLGFIVQNNIDE